MSDTTVIIPEAGHPVYTTVPKPYTINPAVLLTEGGQEILNEDGTELLMEIS